MGIFLLIFVSLFLIFPLLNTKYKFCNPVIIFCFCWILYSFLISLNLFEYYSITFNTYLIIIIGVLFFSLGYYIRVPKLSFSNIRKVALVSNRIYGILLMVGILFEIVILLRVITMLLSGYTFDVIRLSFGNVGLGTLNNAIESLFWGYFIKPMVYVALTQIVVFVFYKHLTNTNLLLTLIFLFLNQMDNSRALIFYFAIMLFFCWYFVHVNTNSKINIKFIVRTLILIVIIYAIFEWMSSLRGVTNSVFRSIYEYFVSGLIQLDIRKNNFSFNAFHYTFGFSFFSGILNPIMLIFEQLKLPIPNLWVNYIEISKDINAFIQISPKNISNAFVTCFYYFYADFSYLGVVIGSIVYGNISKVFFRNIKKESLFYISSYLLILLGIVTSFIRWQFSQPAYLFAFIYLYLIYRKKEIKYEKK